MTRKKLTPGESWKPARSTTQPPDREAFAFSEPRKALIRRLEAMRESKVLVYIESSCGPPEALRYLYEHLRTTHRQTHRQLDLVVFTRHPGDADMERAVQAMALLREHAREVSVLVPSLAHGLGTSLAIGADGVLMHPLATLGRLIHADALTTTHHFGAWLQTAAISSPDKRDEALLSFLKEAGPLALAQARYAKARMGAHLEALIQSRVRPQDAQAPALLALLDDPACPLAHPIERRKAKAIPGLPVDLPDAETEAALWDLFCAYEHPMGLLAPTPLPDAPAAVIESESACHCYTPAGKGKVSRAGGWISLHATELH